MPAFFFARRALFQAERSVVAIEQVNADQWLLGSTDEIKPLLHAPAMEFIEGGPV